ncbi:hypothetical protein ACMDB5_10370 [Flavobacterium sp. W1B]|uniref:hypothetical protein n=1 Tax=Flavobacterium sp. W1B TaxID=3394146 RepID=UPI0039BC501D
MKSKEKLKKEIENSINECAKIILFLQGKLKKELESKFSFQHEYQIWYSKALKIVEFLGKDRFPEFKAYYEIDTKRKSLGYGRYYIQDYIKGVAPSSYQYPDFDTKDETLKNVYNQYTILVSIKERIDSILSDIHSNLLIELQDTELETAKVLVKVNLRASGVVAGVVLESYLGSVVKNHALSISKRNPTLSDFNEILKNNDIYDTTIWRKISYLADIRNICAHKKDVEPTKEQIEELITGVNWVMKNIF